MNRKLLLDSFTLTPALILDCGNAVDVHSLFPEIKEEQLHEVYVINLEAIYRFRKGLEHTPRLIEELKLKQLIVTTVHVLFSYDDNVENFNILEQCWEMMKEISKLVPVNIGISYDKMHGAFAERFADNIITIKALEIGYYHTPRYMGK